MTERHAAVVLASDEAVVGVATAALARGNAVDAVAVGVFAAAGLHPSVLLGPVQMLIGGAGAGLRAIDGRTRQPGKDNPRPRGFRPEDVIPGAARVAVPALPAAVLAAVTTYGKLSFAAILGPAVELARTHSTLRAEAMKRILERGPAALAEAQLEGELVRQAGRLAGGLLSTRDLADVRPAVTPATSIPLGGHQIVTVPWGATAVRDASLASMPGSNVRAVLAADRNGLLAIACYEVAGGGLALDALDLVAPFTAEPVLRGAPRVRPGEPRPAAAPIALSQDDGVLGLVAGIGASAESEAALGAWLAAYRPASELERAGSTSPPGLIGAQRAGSSWTALS